MHFVCSHSLELGICSGLGITLAVLFWYFLMSQDPSSLVPGPLDLGLLNQAFLGTHSQQLTNEAVSFVIVKGGGGLTQSPVMSVCSESGIEGALTQ